MNVKIFQLCLQKGLNSLGSTTYTKGYMKLHTSIPYEKVLQYNNVSAPGFFYFRYPR